jgi:malonate-semialdehyde dehydrogenase (acetylating)/methylmalonate-semialdehyde dehydrogenase
MTATIKNYIDGKWVSSHGKETIDIINPTNLEVLGRTPMGTAQDVNDAVEAAHKAFQTWKATPVVSRIQHFFKLKELLEKNQKEISIILSKENGKTLAEAMGSTRRSIQMVETACGMPNLLMGECLDNVTRDIDSTATRRPLGVFSTIAPFNFPAMVPFWFWPFAVAAGNTYVLKPSELVPLTQMMIFELIEEAGFPKGVMNMVHGASDVGNAILTHPKIKGISFVGSTAIAKHVYSTGTAHGKRVQSLGGAKNFIVILPDAPLEKSVQAAVESCYGCAGERCLAGSNLVAVGDAYPKMKELVLKYVKQIVVGDPLDPKVTMGPVITAKAKERILNDIESGIREGAELLLDGRNIKVPGLNGHFIGPTVFDKVKPNTTLTTKEIFGPVIGLMQVKSLDEAVQLVNSTNYGNTASLFTSNGAAARYFISKVDPSMVGINIGVPAPMSFFSFGGSKDSFFGDVKAHGASSVDFVTEKHTSMIRWFSDSLDDIASPHWSH